MSRALDLAAFGMNTATPNPRVGCVIVKDHQIVGEGWHRRAGEPHAEALALAQSGTRARGATVYVTLEPCSHVGRTPPCADALIEAQVGRVIAAMEDPNPLVSGRGLSRIRAAGIEVRCGLLANQARDLNPGFVSRMQTGRPWVRAKVAASLDGMTALPDGQSQWITGEAARIDGHRWRARACAILTGIGTVRDDDPRLTVRHVPTDRQPLRVLVDSRLEIAPGARLLEGGNLVIFCAQAPHERAARLTDQGVRIIELPDADGKVDLAAMMKSLGELQLNEIHVEAGFKLNGSLMRAACIDEWLVYLAPCLLGQAVGMVNMNAVPSLDERLRFEFRSVDLIGADVRLLARRRDPDTRSGTGEAGIVPV